jgi:hypothetical protein
MNGGTSLVLESKKWKGLQRAAQSAARVAGAAAAHTPALTDSGQPALRRSMSIGNLWGLPVNPVSDIPPGPPTSDW